VVKTRTEFWVKAVKETIPKCSSSVTDHSGDEDTGTGTTSTVTSTVSTPAGINVAGHQRAELFVISALLLLLLLPVMKLIVGRD